MDGRGAAGPAGSKERGKRDTCFFVFFVFLVVHSFSSLLFSLTQAAFSLPPPLSLPPFSTKTKKATEDFIVHLFEDTNLCAIHAKRVTISESRKF